MAIYHFCVKIIGRSSGRSSVAAAAYRAGEKLHNEHDGATHDYSKRNAVNAAAYRSGERLNDYDFTAKRGVVYSEIILPDNSPEEFQDRATLWNAVEKSEKRCDAQTAREIDVALPAELDRHKHIDIMREYIRDNFVNHGMIADFAIHDKGDGNPHAHILLTTRDVTARGFGKKNREWNKIEYLEKWRENWANIVNHELECAGIEERIDHRTLAAQGFTREPTIHVGRSEKRERQNAEIIQRNEIYINELKQGVEILKRLVDDVQTEQVEKQYDLSRINADMKDMAERYNRLCKLSEDLKKDPNNKMLQNSYKQAYNYFEREYKISPANAPARIKTLEVQGKTIAGSLGYIDVELYLGYIKDMENEYKKNMLREPKIKVIPRTIERSR